MYISLNRATAGGGLAFEDFVKTASDAGFPAADVELGWARDRSADALRALFQSHHLRFGGWGVPFDWRGDESKLGPGLRDLDEMAKLAAELRIDRCSTWLLPSSDRPLIENWEFHVARLKPVADVLSGHGLRLGLEFVSPHHLRKHFKHEFLFTPSQVLELADAIGSNVGLLIDSFHCHTSGTPWDDIAAIPASKIVLAHFNDAPAGLPLHKIEDKNRLLPGDGCLDLPGFFSALHAAGYDGPVSLEVFSDELAGLDPRVAAGRAWTATERALKGVSLE